MPPQGQQVPPTAPTQQQGGALAAMAGPSYPQEIPVQMVQDYAALRNRWEVQQGLTPAQLEALANGKVAAASMGIKLFLIARAYRASDPDPWQDSQYDGPPPDLSDDDSDAVGEDLDERGQTIGGDGMVRADTGE